MRPWTLGLFLLLFVALLPTAAAKSGGQFVSDAPVTLTGPVMASSGALTLHHAGFETGSLEAHVFEGRLIDRTTLFLPGNYFPNPSCAQFDGDVEEKILMSVTQVLDKVVVKTRTGSLSRIVAAGGVANVTSAAPFELGPNPYHYESEQLPPEGPTHPTYAPAFPMGEFALVPGDTVDVRETPLTLEVHWGEIEATQRLVPHTYRAGIFEEERTAEVDGPIPGSKEQVKCPVNAVHELLFDMEKPYLTIRQEDVEGTRGFWAGHQAQDDIVPGDASPDAPEGTWDRKEAAEYDEARRRLLLPATVVSGPALTPLVDGKAAFTRALGSVSYDGTLHEAANQDAELVGRFALSPVASEDGHRMTTRIGDGVEDATIEGAKGDQWAAAAPYVMGATGGIAMLGLAYWGWPHLKFGGAQLLLFPLYARLKKEDILENPLRDDILGVVEQTPGISASELGRRMSCGWGTLVYHLTVLERMSLVSSAREGRHKRFFVQGRINYSDKGAVGLLANASARVLLDAVRESPGLIQRDLSRRLGLSAGTIAWHMERLEQGGLIMRAEEGRVVRYYPTQKLLDLSNQLAGTANQTVGGVEGVSS